MSKTIMDVSRWQGNIDWDKVKASGKVDGVMLRAMGNSKTGAPSKPYLDPTFERNYAECTRLGIPVGVYGYFKAVSRAEADKELALLKSALIGKTLRLPVAVDVEDALPAKLSKEVLTDLTAYELKTVQDWGFYSILYTYLSYADKHLYMTGAALKPYDVWLASYRSQKPATVYPYGMWQHTSSGSVPGVAGNVDLSIAYKDYTSIICKKGLTRLREGK